jgi:hypothetical protein
MTDIVKGMEDVYEQGHHASNQDAMRAALLFLANNIDKEAIFEMCKGAAINPCEYAGVMNGKDVYIWERLLVGFQAAIRAAAGGDLPPPPKTGEGM